MGKALDNHNPGQDVPIDKVRSRYNELVRSIRFLGDISVKIHGLLDESEIYKTMLNEFGKSKQYSLSILLLTDDKTHLRFVGTSVTSKKLKAAEKASGLRQKTFLIDLARSKSYSQVVLQGKIVHTPTINIIREVLPRGLTKLVPLIATILGYEKKTTILLPIYTNGSIIGAIGITPPELFEDFVPSVENFSRQVFTALDLAYRDAERKEMEGALRENEMLFSSLLQHSPIYVFFKDSCMRSLRLSENYKQMLGMPIDKALGKTMDELFPSDLARNMVADDRKILEEGKLIRVEEKLNDRDYETIKFPIFMDGKPDILAGFTVDITERKQAEEALREKDFIIRSASSAIATAGMDGNMTYVNPAFLRKWGFDNPDEVIGRPFPEFWMVSDKMDEIMAALRGKEKKWKGEIQAKRKDGSFFNVIVSAATVLDDKGAPVALMSTSVDITKRKQIEIALRESEKSLNEAQHIANLGSWNWDLKTNEVIWSDNMCRMHGMKPEEFDGQFDTVSSLTHPDDLEFVQKNIQQLLDKKQPFKFDYRIIAKDGTVKIVRGDQHFVFDDEGNIVRMNGILQDVTERRKADEALLEASKFRENILSEAPVGITIYDAVSGQCLAGNKAMAELVGASEEQVLSQNFYTIESWKKSGLLETAKSALKDNSKKELDVSVTTTFGKDISFHCYFVPFLAGGKRYLLFTLNDLTERKQLEDQLRQSEKMQAIGQLAGGIAHDFNNQLGGILGYADMLREEVGDNPTLARYADNILISVRRSADLTAQLLAFSRQGKYRDIIVDIHNVIHEVVSMLQHSIDKRIVIKQHLNANPPATTGDPTQLQNAVLNLALNARDAMPRGGELIFSTDVVQVDDSYKKNSSFKITEGTYIQICVTDTGTGMNEETQLHAFEPFYTTKEQGKGIGMGLAAVYGTVKNHKGFINIYSEPGKGSTFKVYLPLAEDKISLSGENEISTPAKTGSGHILLVEDDEMLRNAATDMIEALGYEVTVCADGKDAVTFYKKSWEQVDLVLLDMVMPVMDGRDTFIAMRKINPKIVALLASGYSLDGEAKSILEEGVKGFIQKPYRKAELAEKIAELLGK